MITVRRLGTGRCNGFSAWAQLSEGGGTSGYDQGTMTRVGDRERERSAQALRRHYVEGRLDETELSERLERVLQARSRRELRIALRQLPRWGDFELPQRGDLEHL